MLEEDDDDEASIMTSSSSFFKGLVDEEETGVGGRGAESPRTPSTSIVAISGESKVVYNANLRRDDENEQEKEERQLKVYRNELAARWFLIRKVCMNIHRRSQCASLVSRVLVCMYIGTCSLMVWQPLACETGDTPVWPVTG